MMLKSQTDKNNINNLQKAKERIELNMKKNIQNPLCAIEWE